MDKLKFSAACDKIININRVKNGIGTLGEKTLHAVLKNYFEENENNHEVKIGSYVSDIKNDAGIIEIQTGNFNKLRKKLEIFLETENVTLVYPIAKIKWLLWIDEETGEVTKKRKSPKQGRIHDIFYELYKIKAYLENPKLKICIVMLELHEYRYLNGWSEDKKKGSHRCDRIPIDILDEIYIDSIQAYEKFLPESAKLKIPFTSKDYKAYTGLSMSSSQTALNILNFLGVINKVTKCGNAFLYDIKANITETERLNIRYFKSDDLNSLYNIMKKPEVMYAWEHGFTKAETKKWLDNQILRYKNDGYGYFAIMLKDKLIGQVGLGKSEINGEDIIELGYIFDDSVWGQGYAFEAAKACIKLAFEKHNIDKLYCAICPENTRSINLAVKLGMTQTDEYNKIYNDKKMLHLIFVLEKYTKEGDERI